MRNPLNLRAFVGATKREFDAAMNVLPPHWVSFYPSASNPVVAALARTFELQRKVPPHIQALLEQLDRRHLRP